MRIVQVSDIHIGSPFNQKVFDMLVEEVKNLKPDAIIITGDLTDDGLLFQFERAMTLGTARPDRDEGEVGYRQNKWMIETLARYENKTKIIAMHHHLIGIPDTGTDKIIILDAGDTLRACLRSKVDLVLCGHKHRPWVWMLGSLEIAYAGTASSTRFRGFFENAYNIVEVKNGKLQIDIKIVGGKRVPLVNLVNKYKPFLELDGL